MLFCMIELPKEKSSADILSFYNWRIPKIEQFQVKWYLCLNFLSYLLSSVLKDIQSTVKFCLILENMVRIYGRMWWIRFPKIGQILTELDS